VEKAHCVPGKKVTQDFKKDYFQEGKNGSAGQRIHALYRTLSFAKVFTRSSN
jgi:hypothetical protein